MTVCHPRRAPHLLPQLDPRDGGVLDAAHQLGGGDDGVGLWPAAQAGHVEDGLTEVVQVDGVDALLGPVETDG